MGLYRAVLLDATDTIWRPSTPPEAVWPKVLQRLGCERSTLEIKAANESVRRRFAARMDDFETSGRSTDEQEIDNFWVEYDSSVLDALGVAVDAATVRAVVLPQFTSDESLFPETREVLDRLHAAGYRLAVVSNGAYQERRTKKLGIAGYFDAIIGSWHVGFRKPMPEIFELTISRLRTRPDEAVMVGDDPEIDVAAAREFGITALLLDRDDASSRSRDSIADLWGLVQFLEEHARE